MKPASIPAAKPPKEGCGLPVRKSTRSRWRTAVLIGVHVVMLAHVAHWYVTGHSLSPVEPSEAQHTLAYGAVNAGFVLLVVLILSTLILGRFFCGWACHLVAYQDLCAWLLGKLGIRPRPVRSRLLMFVPFLAAAYVFLKPAVARMVAGQAFPGLSWELGTEDIWATMPGPWIASLTLFVDGFLIVYLLGAKGFCTYGCPYGALFVVADRASRARIRVTDACEGCGHCTATCTSNVDVRREVALYKMVVDPGCMKCTDCVSVCPKGALYFGFGPAPAKDPGKSRKAARPYDFTWPEELALAAVFLAALFSFLRLYDLVPFLLAVGLAVMAAVAALAGWRLVSRPTFAFQHHALKGDGKLTGTGFAATALVPAFLALTLHSGLVRYNVLRGDVALAHVPTFDPGSTERRAEVTRAIEHFERVERWGLVANAGLHNKLGQLWIDADRNDRAEPYLRRAIALDDGMISARTRLAEVLIVATRYAEATELLAEILERDPRNDTAGRRLAYLLGLEPDLDDARLLLVDLLVRLGDLDGAEYGLQALLDRDPEHPGALERAATIRAAREE